MRDEDIIKLFMERKEAAITETQSAYGKYLLKITYNILGNTEDCKECINDTYLKAWNSIPPHNPAVLSVYLGKIARETAIDAYRKQNRQKRKGSEYSLTLDELSECVSGNENTETAVDSKLLGKEISRFLRSLPYDACRIFTMRYYHSDSVKDISLYFGMSEARVKGILHRTRKQLRKHLEKEGFSL